MDPLSITTSCMALISSVVQTSVKINDLVRDLPNARNDVDAMSQALLSLKASLELLYSASMSSTVSDLPPSLLPRCHEALAHGAVNLENIVELLEEYSINGPWSHLRRSLLVQNDLKRLRSNVQSCTSTLHVAANNVMNVSMTRDIKYDIAEFPSLTMAALQDHDTQIALLHSRIPEYNSHRQDQRKLKEIADDLIDDAAADTILSDNYTDREVDLDTEQSGNELVEGKRTKNVIPEPYPGLRQDSRRVLLQNQAKAGYSESSPNTLDYHAMVQSGNAEEVSRARGPKRLYPGVSSEKNSFEGMTSGEAAHKIRVIGVEHGAASLYLGSPTQRAPGEEQSVWKAPHQTWAWPSLPLQAAKSPYEKAMNNELPKKSPVDSERPSSLSPEYEFLEEDRDVVHNSQNREDDTQSRLSDASNDSSLYSVPDSIFSAVTGSSMSSVPSLAGAGQRVVILLLADSEMMSLCHEAIAVLGREKSERNLRRLIKSFAVELKIEAGTEQQRQAVRYVRYRARNTAYMVCDNLSDRLANPEDVIEKVIFPEKFMETLQVENAIESEDSDSDRSSDEVDDLQLLEKFISGSAAFRSLVKNFRDFLHPDDDSQDSQEGRQDGSSEEENDVQESVDVLQEEVSTKLIPAPVVQSSHTSSAEQNNANRNQSLIEAGSAGVFLLTNIVFCILDMKDGFNTTSVIVTFGLACISFTMCYKSLCNVLDSGLRRPPVLKGEVRVEWKCKCGHSSWDDFTERYPGAAKESIRGSLHTPNAIKNKDQGSAKSQKVFVSSFRDRLSVLICMYVGLARYYRTPTAVNLGNRQKSSQRYESSGTHQGYLTFSGGFHTLRNYLAGRVNGPDLPLHGRGSSQSIGSVATIEVAGAPENMLFLLLCYSEGRYATKLLQLDLVTLRATSDKALFQILRENYVSMRRKWVSNFSLRALVWIKFVHFEMYRSELVDVRKVNDLPPPDHVEYRYAPAPPDVIPPIGDRHMMHLFHNPECAEDEALCLSRFPKKLKEKLKCNGGINPGWGLQFVEGWDVRKIVLLLVVCSGLGSLLVGVLWSVFKHSVQDAFSIAAYMLAFVGVTIGGLQALLVM